LQIAARYGTSGAARHALRIAFAYDARPSRATISRLEQSRAYAARLERVRRAETLPHPQIDDVGVRRIERDVDGTRTIVCRRLDQLPGRAAVCRLVEPVLTAGLPRRPERRDVDDVRVA